MRKNNSPGGRRRRAERGGPARRHPRGDLQGARGAAAAGRRGRVRAAAPAVQCGRRHAHPHAQAAPRGDLRALQARAGAAAGRAALSGRARIESALFASWPYSGCMPAATEAASTHACWACAAGCLARSQHALEQLPPCCAPSCSDESAASPLRRGRMRAVVARCSDAAASGGATRLRKT
jgi:hypothetical protein